ncbi:hypothetical protein Dimus_021149, partial [Dionaea muscipula]
MARTRLGVNLLQSSPIAWHGEFSLAARWSFTITYSVLIAFCRRPPLKCLLENSPSSSLACSGCELARVRNPLGAHTHNPLGARTHDTARDLGLH